MRKSVELRVEDETTRHEEERRKQETRTRGQKDENRKEEQGAKEEKDSSVVQVGPEKKGSLAARFSLICVAFAIIAGQLRLLEGAGSLGRKERGNIWEKSEGERAGASPREWARNDQDGQNRPGTSRNKQEQAENARDLLPQATALSAPGRKNQNNRCALGAPVLLRIFFRPPPQPSSPSFILSPLQTPILRSVLHHRHDVQEVSARL